MAQKVGKKWTIQRVDPINLSTTNIDRYYADQSILCCYYIILQKFDRYMLGMHTADLLPPQSVSRYMVVTNDQTITALRKNVVH